MCPPLLLAFSCCALGCGGSFWSGARPPLPPASAGSVCGRVVGSVLGSVPRFCALCPSVMVPFPVRWLLSPISWALPDWWSSPQRSKKPKLDNRLLPPGPQLHFPSCAVPVLVHLACYRAVSSCPVTGEQQQISAFQVRPKWSPKHRFSSSRRLGNNYLVGGYSPALSCVMHVFRGNTPSP